MKSLKLLPALVALLASPGPALAEDSFAQTHWQQELTFEARQFAQTSPYVDHNQDISLGWQARYESQWNDGDDTFTFIPFARYNSQDSERSRLDIQSLSWTHVDKQWEVRSGIRTVTWQVTESVHLVDIINQLDLTGDIDGEDKLGQAMVNLMYKFDAGNIELYLLPGFREQILPGDRARLRGPFELNKGNTTYESAAEKWRTDIALRSTWFPGDWEIALSHFTGTSRDPVISLAGEQLQAFYPVIDQTGLELQYASGDWLWKLESISRSGFNDLDDNGFNRYEAAVGGFEFTWSGLGETGYDLGILSEYLWDSRRDEPLANDLFIAVRLGLNDIDSTDLLAGLFQDLDHGEYLGFAEFSRRIGETGRLAITLRMIGSGDSSSEKLENAEFLEIHRDDYLSVEYTHYL